MAKRIDLSFSTNPTAPLPTDQDEYAYGSGGGDVQDTVVLQQDADTSEAREENAAKLEQLRVGAHTVAEMVKGLEKVLGHEFYPARIVEKGEDTTRVFFEIDRPKADSSEAKLQSSIYEIADGGEVNTSRVRHPKTDYTEYEDRMFVKFQTKFTMPPSVIVGLNYLDATLGNECYPQFGGSAQRIYDHLFEVNSKVLRRPTCLFGAGFAWLAVPTYAYPLLQTGVLMFDASDETVLFKTPYKSTPRVIVWLSCINSNHESKPRIAVSPKDIKPTGFQFDIRAVGGYGALYSGYISWFAYPADTPGICSGDLHPTYGTADIITFDKPFAKTPRRILVALNGIEIYPANDCHFRIIHEAVSERGMAVRVESWGPNHSHIRKVGVSYIVME